MKNVIDRKLLSKIEGIKDLRVVYPSRSQPEKVPYIRFNTDEVKLRIVSDECWDKDEWEGDTDPETEEVSFGSYHVQIHLQSEVSNVVLPINIKRRGRIAGKREIRDIIKDSTGLNWYSRRDLEEINNIYCMDDDQLYDEGLDKRSLIIHPHIRRELPDNPRNPIKTNICWGSYKPPIHRSLVDRDYTTAVYLVNEFLHTVNWSDMYRCPEDILFFYNP